MQENKQFSDTKEDIERASKASGVRTMLDELAKKMRNGGTALYKPKIEDKI